jgi:hypothetical protein
MFSCEGEVIMRSNQWEMTLLVLLTAAGFAPGLAQAGGGAVGDAVGRVETVYVRESRDLFIEKKLVQKTAGRELWVEVNFAQESNPELYRMPVDVKIERGDVVATHAGDSKLHANNLVPQVNRVTEVVAPHDRVMAMSFGLSAAPGVLFYAAASQACGNAAGRFTAQAGACPAPR